MYEILFSSGAKKELKRLPISVIRLIKIHFDQLALNPLVHSQIKKMVLPGKFYRLRIGDYRILFSLDHSLKKIIIITIGHRSHIYRKLR